MSTLRTALSAFIERYHDNATLVAEQAGWNCRILLVASDSGETVPLVIADGRVREIDAMAEEVTLVVTADKAVLLDVLELRRDPNEPYLFGELTIEGPEADFMRLDYVMTIMTGVRSQ
jgi:putative sterol carrier protein